MADFPSLKGILGAVKEGERLLKDITEIPKDVGKILDAGSKGIGQIKELLGEQTSINIGTVSKQAASVEVLLERHGFAGFDANKKDGKISSGEYERIADFIKGKPGLDGEITRNGRDIVLSKKAIDTLTAEPNAAPAVEMKAEPAPAASAPNKMDQLKDKAGSVLRGLGDKIKAGEVRECSQDDIMNGTTNGCKMPGQKSR